MSLLHSPSACAHPHPTTPGSSRAVPGDRERELPPTTDSSRFRFASVDVVHDGESFAWARVGCEEQSPVSGIDDDVLALQHIHTDDNVVVEVLHHVQTDSAYRPVLENDIPTAESIRAYGPAPFPS